MDSKRKNVYITIFVITTILAACIAVYFYLKYTYVKNELSAKENVIEETNKKLEEETSKNSQQVSENKEVKLEYNPIRIKNGYTDKNVSVVYGNIMEDDKEKIGFGDVDYKLNINSDGKVSITRNGTNIQINNVDEKVIDYYVGTIGDGAGQAIILLDENGSVYFTDEYALKENTVNFSKIKNISNIKRIVRVKSTLVAEVEDDIRTNTRMTFVGIDSNGGCYDLFPYNAN